MRYMLMMNMPPKNSEYRHDEWAPDAWKNHMAFMHALNQELKDAGEFVGVYALTAPTNARLVKAGTNGLPATTDGPFAETKEFLAGFWIVDVEGDARALAIAEKVSTAPGPDGAPLLMEVEVREVMTIRAPEL